jgi:hypothetical protein
MQPKLTTKPVSEVIAAINALDLESVKLRVMDAELGEGWTRAYADSIEAAYKNYLIMLVKYPDDCEDILLSKDVDEFWHTHILQTLRYVDDCQNVFGNYLHHDPHVGERSPAVLEKRVNLAEKTLRLYEREFGNGQYAELAWSGAAIAAPNAAMSNMAIRSDNAAMSNMAIRANNAAMSNMAIRANNAAMSNMAIRANNAAMSNMAIRANNAAMSNMAIWAKTAAMPEAAIQL